MKTNNKKAVGLGEVLLRLTAPSGTLIRNANNFSVNYGGSEANVIISLAHLGYSGVFISKMAEDELGQACRDYLVANGVDIIKIFPGSAATPSYFKAVHGPLPQANLMPTGGVTIANAKDWIKAGAVAIGTGSDLSAPAKTGNYEEVTSRAKAFVKEVQEARKEGQK
jgi:sugar/nucleoside kinase (ribokinase family)